MKTRFAAGVFALSLAALGQQSDPGTASSGQSNQHKSKESAKAKVGGPPTQAAEKSPTAAEGRPRAGYETGTGSGMAGGRTDTGPVGSVRRKPGKSPVRMRATAKDKAQAKQRGKVRDREQPAQPIEK